MNLLCVSRHFDSTPMRSNCRNHIDKIKNKSENVYESYKTFSANIYFAEVIKVFNKQ